MRYICIVFAISVLFVPQSQGQSWSAKEWIGMARDSVEAKRSGEDWEVITNEDDTYCAEVELVSRLRYCYNFVENKCWRWSESDLRETKKNALKEVVKMSRRWGEPIAYYADRTKVSGIDQAVALADPVATVVFPGVDGVGALWQLRVEPHEEAGPIGGKYTFVQSYVDLDHSSQEMLINYWR